MKYNEESLKKAKDYLKRTYGKGNFSRKDIENTYLLFEDTRIKIELGQIMDDEHRNKIKICH